MPDFNVVEDTLFVPMLGRIYSSEKFPNILLDKKALELKNKLPKNIKGKDTQSQYTLMASAVRSTNMDRYIQNFLSENKNGIIAQLGCGLETTYYRNNKEGAMWYEFDLPEVVDYRKKLLGENENEKTISADAFSDEWIKTIRKDYPTQPILVTASGLFYYFEREKVVNLLKMLKNYGNVQVVFDTVNSSGMKRMTKYMKMVGHADASMYFFVDNAQKFAEEVDAKEVFEEPYYSHTNKKGLNLVTKLSMKISDKFKMVKMLHLKMN